MDTQNELKDKIEKWINSEGTPLEYYTSSIYMKEGFRALQSDFVEENGISREVDVTAFLDYKLEDTTLRILNVIECKWSKDKPWIIFTAPTVRMSPAASITQTFGNKVGCSLLWHMASEKELYDLKLFNNKRPNGFSGRQAFTKDSDLFYASIQSIISKTLLSLKQFDRQPLKKPFDYIAIGFPVIVIDAPLFESTYINEKIELKQVTHSRVQWRGSTSWKYLSKVDIVTKEYLPEYVTLVKQEFDLLSKLSGKSLNSIKAFFNTKDINLLQIKQAPRGIIGLPEFLYEIKNGILS